MSPGWTTRPPQAIGTLISPGPSLRAVRRDGGGEDRQPGLGDAVQIPHGAVGDHRRQPSRGADAAGEITPGRVGDMLARCNDEHRPAGPAPAPQTTRLSTGRVLTVKATPQKETTGLPA